MRRLIHDLIGVISLMTIVFLLGYFVTWGSAMAFNQASIFFGK